MAPVVVLPSSNNTMYTLLSPSVSPISRKLSSNIFLSEVSFFLNLAIITYQGGKNINKVLLPHYSVIIVRSKMTEIALFANTNEKDLEQMVSSLEVPGLTHLVLQELGWQAGGVYSPQWDAMTPDERGKTDHNFRKRHVDHYN